MPKKIQQRGSIKMTPRPDPISLEVFPMHRAIKKGEEYYDPVFLMKWFLANPNKARYSTANVPHTRQRFSHNNINAIMTRTGHVRVPGVSSNFIFDVYKKKKNVQKEAKLTARRKRRNSGLPYYGPLEPVTPMAPMRNSRSTPKLQRSQRITESNDRTRRSLANAFRRIL